jgi:electron transfer flavoprotein beta subunit
MKWVDLRPEVDPLTGAVRCDVRTSGPSAADEAALEWALRIGEAWGVEVVAVTAGPGEADGMLRDALARGAAHALRIEATGDATSGDVAAAIAQALPPAVDVVVCGAWSTDRGSGSVPAFLAAELHAAQALGLVSLTLEEEGTTIQADRRLDGGRRERLRIEGRAVLSVEAGGVRLRRAGLGSVLAAGRAVIDVASRPPVAPPAPLVRTAPFRPRARVLAGPGGQLDARARIVSLTGALVDRDPPRVVRLGPAAAADELLAQLQAWGYR